MGDGVACPRGVSDRRRPSTQALTTSQRNGSPRTASDSSSFSSSSARCTHSARLSLLLPARLLRRVLLRLRLILRALIRVEDKVLAGGLLLTVLCRVLLVHTWPEVDGISAEGDVQLLQKLVEALLEALRRVGGALDAGLTSVHDHTVGQRRGHHKIVLDDEGRLLQV